MMTLEKAMGVRRLDRMMARKTLPRRGEIVKRRMKTNLKKSLHRRKLPKERKN